MDFKKRATEITSDLIKIKSITFNELIAAEYLQGFLRNLGFDVQIDESNNVIGELKGKYKGPRLFFLGHHDTVEEGDHSLWTHPPFSGKVFENELWGRGAVDEKGGLGACLAAIEKIVEDNPEGLYGDILFVSTREETSDIETRGIMKFIEKGIQADYCVVVEPTELNIVLGHKGRVVIEISTKGKNAHSSVPEEGINAINHMSHIVLELEKMKLPNRSPLGQGTQSIGIIKGGERPNIVPDKCSIEIDRRIIGGETPESVIKEIEMSIASVKNKLPELNAETKIKLPFYPSYIEEDSPIVEIAKNACELLDIESKILYEDFHTDGEWIVNEAKIPAIILGPGPIARAHAVDERVDVEELGKVAAIYHEIMQQVLVEDKSK